MEDSDGISDNEIARDDELSVTQGETDEVESEDYVNRRHGRRITFTYPKPKKPDEPPEPPEPEPDTPEPDTPESPQDDEPDERTPQQRVEYLESRVRGFRIASAGDGILRGGFGQLPTGITDLMQQMANIAKAMDQFQMVGDNLNVQGSFDKGYAVSRENPCQQQQVNPNPE